MESFGKTGDRFAVSFTCCFSQKIITCIALSLILFPRWGIWNTLGFAAHVFCHDFFSVWINECWSDLACSQAIWPVLILTLLMVSQWIKTDWHCSIFDTVTTGWHVRDTLSLQMSSLLSSWKVVKSVWMFVRAFVFVCVWTCKKEVCGVHLGGKVVVMFFYFFFCCPLWVLLEIFEVLHRRLLLTLLFDDLKCFYYNNFTYCYYIAIYIYNMLLTSESLFFCTYHLAKTFFLLGGGGGCSVLAPFTSVLSKWVPDWKERWRRIVVESIRWLRRRRAEPKQGSVHRNAVQLCRDSQFGRAGVRADWVDSL